MMFSKYLPLLAIFFSFTSNAELILTVARDDLPQRDYRIFVNTDEAGNLTHLQYTVHDPKEKFKPKTFSIKAMMTEEGAELDHTHGRVATLLKALEKFTPQEGGNIQFEYLTNYLTGNRDRLVLALRRVGTSWSIYKPKNNQLVKSLFCEIGTIGANICHPR